MTKGFWIITTLIFAAFGMYELFLNLSLRDINDDFMAVCFKPARIQRQAVFVLSAEEVQRPMARGVLRVE
jgi:hypothetical protein